VQRELDGAVNRKAYSECAPLQEKLDELIAKRSEMPTIDELRQAVRDLEDMVAQAAKSKDYVGAAKGQNRLDDARNRLADVLAADGADDDEADDKENLFGFESRAQLELEISDLSVQIKKAVESKNFTKASSLQHVLDERERLRKLFPSAEELQGELSLVKQQLDEAIAKKDFATAGRLNEEIARLESKIQAEQASFPDPSFSSSSKLAILSFTGEERAFETRGELEAAIANAMTSVKKSVAQRDFKGAESHQMDVDKMVVLRDALPSLVELQHQLVERKKEMNAAIAAKKFAKADELNAVVETLTSRIEKEKKAMKATSSGDKKVVGAPASVKSTPVAGTSAPSIGSHPSALSAPAQAGLPTEVRQDNMKSVRKLRPAVPVVSLANDSILSVAKTLSKKRANSSIIVDSSTGELVGIITSTDFTRRVVSRGIDPNSATIASIMTPNPTCVSMADPAVDALTTMVENRFRHLPVVEDDGSVAGVLDISKCLTEAIAKLEGAQEAQSLSTAEDVAKLMKSKHGDGANAAGLHSLLSVLMGQATGAKSAPTLRSLLHEKPSTMVHPDQSVREASFLMTENRHAALIVDESGEVQGVFGFKDMMTRAIAKEIDLDNTPVSEVMTMDPVTVFPDVTVVEALHMMVDHRVLTLPVCEKNGDVIGLVDVMDVIYGCGGTEGWRSVFSSAMDIDDDVSDVTSVHSATSGKRPSIAGPSDALLLSAVKESVEERPVAKLRPSKPIVTSTDDTLLRAAKLMTSKRTAAALIVDSGGALTGILTDKDITCRAVAKLMDPSATFVNEVMTPNPTCVSSNDAAMDALTLMVENRFRHLPVVDDHGAVVGTLDIVKCLSSIIGRLEKVEKVGAKSATDMVKQVVGQHGASGEQAEALQALLGSLLSQATGGKAVPTLRSLLHGKPSTVVSPNSSIRDTGMVMAEHRHGALVVNENGVLVGIFTFKDMMSRAVANELDIDSVPVCEVMTAHPETVLPEITVLEALQIMADNKFLTLPVCESSGHVLGVVDALDVIYGCGGSEGWRSVFSRAMEASDDGNSVLSGHSKSVNSVGTGRSKDRKKSAKTVSNLRPSKPILSLSTESIVSVAQLLQRKRGDSSLVVTPEGDLAGILTDTDFTRRAVARNIDPETTPVSAIMTPDPTCVALSDSALDALTTMVENHFRHLPVVDDEGAVVGVLDIGKCLNDAIERLEQQGGQVDKSSVDGSLDDAVKQVASLHGVNSAQAAALQMLLGSLMKQAAGGKSLPTLRSLLQQRPSTVVGPSSTVREAGLLMAESRKAALVVEEGRLVGIFGFKDMMNRCIAELLDLDMAPIGEVMTPDPESVSPDITVLEALYIMYDHKFLTLPVCESNGKVVGLVDVMDVIYGCGGSAGWRSIFASAMDMYDDEEESKSIAVSVTSKGSKASPSNRALPPGIPSNLEFDKMHGSLISQRLFAEGEDGSNTTDLEKPVFKVVDPTGKTYKIKCESRISALLNAVSEKTLIPRSSLQLQYVDEVEDVVTMTCDDDVAEVWNLAKKSGSKIAKLSALACETKAKAAKDQQFMIAAGVAAAAAFGGLAFMLLRPRQH
jgi:CBS domain-containing protein